MAYLLSAWAWIETVTLVLLGTPIMFVVFCITAPFDRGRYVSGRLFRLIGVASVKLNPLWRFDTTGHIISDPRRPYVVVSNHESYADIFLISHLPWEMKWMSKETMFKVPFFGWMMRMAGDIAIVRGEKTSTIKAMTTARALLKANVSIMMFPEGTRSREGEMLPFKDGAFKLALEAGAPILPLVVWGTRDAMAKGTFRFQRARARVRVLPPIDTADMSLDDVAVLRDRTRAVIDAARSTLAAELAARQ